MYRGDVHAGIWWGKPDGKRPLGRPRGRGADNTKTNLQEVEAWTGSIWLREGEVAGFCKCGNEPSGSIKRGNILEELTNC
jgi:hypothetical protein